MPNEGAIRRPTAGEVDNDGRHARYCTVDDLSTGSGTGAVELPENGNTVTIFGRICSEFTEKVFGDEYWLIEAAISQVNQSVGRVHATNPQNDVQIVHTLFLRGTVQIIGNVPQGTVIFESPPIFLARRCGPQTYNPDSPGFAKTKSGREALRQADRIGMISFSWHYGIAC
jgi:hypothetical protein